MSLIQRDLIEINEKLSLLTASNPNHVVFDNAQLAEFLNVTTRTLQKWRNDGIITFRKVGSCIFYTLTDVLDFLDRHRIEAVSLTKSKLLNRAA